MSHTTTAAKAIMRTLAISLVFMMLPPAFAQEATISELRELLPGVGAKEIDQREQAQQKWESLCYPLSRPGNDERAAVCRAMAEMIGDAKPGAQRFILRQLERVGGEEVVPALATLLASEKPQLREAARRALANNPSPLAGKALIDRFSVLNEGNRRERTNILNAIGYRHETASAPFLAQVAGQSEGKVMTAALAALSQIANDDSAKLLKKGTDKDALLRLADQMAAMGNTQAGLAIYRPLARNQPDTSFGVAAYRGLLDHEDESRAAELITAALAGENKRRRQVAMARVRTLPEPAVNQLASELGKLPMTGQVALLIALGTRDEPGGGSAVLKAAESTESEVRIAAIDALGSVGDASALPQLMKWLRSDGAESDSAKSALQRMQDDSIDDELVKIYEATSDPGLRIQLLELLNHRRAIAALPAFVSALQDRNREIRQRAFGSLSRLGTADEVANMISALSGLDGKDRDQAEKHIVNMCRRIPAGAEPVVTLFQSSNAKAKTQLMPLLGRIGDARSLSTIRSAMESRDDGQSEAALNALTNWPNHEVAADLKQVAISTESVSHRTRALRGLARVCVLGGDDEEKLAYLKFVFEAANRNDEKILALERAKAVRTVDSLDFVLPYVEDAELGERARQTVVDLAHHRGLREPNRDVFEPALKQVEALTKDSQQLERIRKYLANE